MNQQEHEVWNEKMAVLYDPDTFITKSGAIIRWVEACRLAKTNRSLLLEPHHSLLDLGCGSGNLLEQVQAKTMVGLDISDSLLASARKRLQGRPGVQLLKSAAEKIPFEAKTFDRVVCSEVLEHVLDPNVVIQEIARVCKPDALVVLTIPNERLINLSKQLVLATGIKKWIAGQYPMSENMRDEWHRSEITLKSLIRLTTPFFRLIGSHAAPFLFLPYHRIYVFKPIK